MKVVIFAGGLNKDIKETGSHPKLIRNCYSALLKKPAEDKSGLELAKNLILKYENKPG